MSDREIVVRPPSWGALASRAVAVVRAELTAWRLERSAPVKVSEVGALPAKRNGAYAGAVYNRLNEDWILAPITSADQDIRLAHRRLVARARDLARNDAHARRYVGLVSQNVIGPKGIRLQARVTNGAGKFDDKTNTLIEDAWCEWGKPGVCTADGRMSWIDVQNTAIEGKMRDGEAIIRLLPGFPNKYGFAVQVLDPDQLDVEYNATTTDGHEVRMGVEIDKWGRPLAFWLWDGHPADYQFMRTRERIRVPAENLIHLYRVERPGQTRGVTRFASVLTKIKHLAGYQEAELIAARTSAAKMGFFTQTGENAPDNTPDPNAVQQNVPLRMDASPGTMEMLPPGVGFEPWDPQHPSAAYEPYTKSVKREISVGLGVAYASLTGDLSDTSYSSSRSGLLVEREEWKVEQEYLATHLHTRVYLAWLKWAQVSGALTLPSRNMEARCEHIWLPRGWAWIDPMKDMAANILAIGAGLDSRTRIAGDEGNDLEEIFAELERENLLAEQYNISIESDTKGDNANVNNSNSDGSDNGTGDSGSGDGNENSATASKGRNGQSGFALRLARAVDHFERLAG